ncbi:immunity protein Tsi6 family protein [Enterobacter cloacae]|uniref:immunity protein Tsi6 family protein n=1 Tax=Enterobacter cloacae TaxID=550 RepID=UPI001E396F90|nr:immunity protein Tsi6 family protein [Enterobacter cloacae]MCM7134587.1 immunity protein Tsi6 family protein [Enterobacter cloacae]
MNITAKNKIFYFWGIMDVIGIVFYFVGPYHLLQSWWDSTGGNFGVIIFMLIAGGVNGLLTGLFYLVYLLWPVSLLFSAWFFFTTHRYAVRFALAQEVLRLLTMSCSVTLFPMIIVGLGMSVISLNITLFILSEIVKIGSLIFVMKKWDAGDGANKFLPLTERDYIDRALRLAQKRYAVINGKYPREPILHMYDEIVQQLRILKKIVIKNKADKSVLKRMTFGIYAVREFENSDELFFERLTEAWYIADQRLRGVKVKLPHEVDPDYVQKQCVLAEKYPDEF